MSSSAGTDELFIAGAEAFKRNDLTAAASHFEKLLRLDPSSFDAKFWSSLVMRRQGRLDDALAMAEQAVAADPGHGPALNQLGMCLLDARRPDRAIEYFQRAIQTAPETGPFVENLGLALQALGQNQQAIAAYQRALSIGPVRVGALLRLGDLLMLQPDVEGAAQCAHAVLRMEPNSAPGNLLLARALIGDGQVAKGAEVAQRAMTLSPNSAVPVAYYGRALQSLGRIAEADEEFRKSIEMEPRQGFAYHALTHNHKVTEAERPMVVKMEELALDSGLPKRETIQLEYGLGKAHEDLGEYESAMRHFDRANNIDHDLKVGVVPFDKEQLRGTADFLIRTFDQVFIEANRDASSYCDVPIFVIGMMRSGTTLAEQILSSHPQIGGAGELLFWPENAGSSEKLFGTQFEHPVLNKAQLRELSAAYLQLLEKVAPGKAKVVDKMNTNYLLVGLLHLLYPNARFVHMIRHPVDTCLSIWATPVANGIDLCGDKSNVVFAYRQYQRIMAHWRQVIPSDRLLDVQYEELVSDRERVTQQLVEFCGMPWDEACMKPEANTRSVKTPSVWQVRQPVYKTSVERWRKYEPWLGPFAELFEPAAL